MRLSPLGKEDIDGLHMAIGQGIVSNKKKLRGREFRFLRNKFLLSQESLGRLLQVKELTVARREKEQARVPWTADAAIRLLYRLCSL
jgi:DNA-binding transcriptional regulator YiaG